MIKKDKEKEVVIRLRKEGKTYSEIMAKIPVAKSTIAIWLQDVGLGKRQEQRITKLKVLAQKNAAEAKRNKRIKLSEEIYSNSLEEIGNISKRELWLLGIMLYWAEGSKQKEWNVSQPIQFTNSDPIMVKFFVNWLRNSLKVNDGEISASLMIHENQKDNIKDVLKFWKDYTGLNKGFSDKVYLKRHIPGTFRHNLGKNYRGTVRVSVKKSTNLNRQIAGWINGVCKNCEIV